MIDPIHVCRAMGAGLLLVIGLAGCGGAAPNAAEIVDQPSGNAPTPTFVPTDIVQRSSQPIASATPTIAPAPTDQPTAQPVAQPQPTAQPAVAQPDPPAPVSDDDDKDKGKDDKGKGGNKGKGKSGKNDD